MKILLQQKLMNEILRTTAKIQTQFPAHYEHLDETPLFMFDGQKGISNVDFEHYLESLVVQLTAFKKADQLPVNV